LHDLCRSVEATVDDTVCLEKAWSKTSRGDAG
jgi:hypothetical protein